MRSEEAAGGAGGLSEPGGSDLMAAGPVSRFRSLRRSETLFSFLLH